jgi:hypothetical protein
VSVALNDLRRHRIDSKAQHVADIVFEVGWHVRMCADRPGNLADRDAIARGLQTLTGTAHFVVPDR